MRLTTNEVLIFIIGLCIGILATMVGCENQKDHASVKSIEKEVDKQGNILNSIDTARQEVKRAAEAKKKNWVKKPIEKKAEEIGLKIDTIQGEVQYIADSALIDRVGLLIIDSAETHEQLILADSASAVRNQIITYKDEEIKVLKQDVGSAKKKGNRKLGIGFLIGYVVGKIF